MMDWFLFWEDYFDTLLRASPFFVTAMVIVAMLSNELARRANRIASESVQTARDANRLTKDALVSNLLPWLQVDGITVDPIRNGGNDSDSGTTALTMNAELTNRGSAPAFITGAGLLVPGVAELKNGSDDAPIELRTVVMPGARTALRFKVPMRSGDAMQRDAVATGINFGECEVMVAIRYDDVMKRTHTLRVVEKRSSPTAPWMLDRYEVESPSLADPYTPLPPARESLRHRLFPRHRLRTA